MNIYFAGRYSRLAELLGYKREIEADAPDYEAEVSVTSRWLLGGHEWVGVDDDELPSEVAAGFAFDDLDDIDQSDLMVCFTESPRTSASRGGRHVEFGVALERGMSIICVGHRENVFYHAPSVAFAPTWADAKLQILMRASSSPTLVRRIIELEQRARSLEQLLAAVTENRLQLEAVLDLVEIPEQPAAIPAELPASIDVEHLAMPDLTITAPAPEPPPARLTERSKPTFVTPGPVVAESIVGVPAKTKPAKPKKLLGAGNVLSGKKPDPIPPAEDEEKAGSWNAGRVRRLQALLGLDNEELSRILGVSSSHISNWRRGAYAPSEKHWPALADLEREAKRAV